MIQEKILEIEKLKEKIEQIVEHWGFTGDSKIQKIVDVNSWLQNFDALEISTIFNLIGRIDLQRDTQINNCLSKIVDEIKKDFGNNVERIKIFSIGDNAASSGSQFLYYLRTNLKLGSSHFPSVPNPFTGNSFAYIFIDDFIGSGRQATEYYNEHLSKFNIKCFYYSLYGYQKGIDYIKKNSGFQQVFVSEPLNNSNKIFSTESTLKLKEECKEIAQKWGEKLYPKHPLGYEDSQSMICFLENCPNNTLPIIWAGPKSESTEFSWNPLFERKKVLPNVGIRNTVTKMQKEPSKLIDFFYNLIEDKKFDLAFECLSQRLKNEKYKTTDVKYFASGYNNTLEIYGLTQKKIVSHPKYSRFLVHYNEKVQVFEFNDISNLHKIKLSEIEQAFTQISLFRSKLVDDLNANSSLVDMIPLSSFFSINAVEECCWYSQIPFEEIAKNFKYREVAMSRAKYVDCKKVGNLWYIDKFNVILHSSESI